jgi:hypothetical protein
MRQLQPAHIRWPKLGTHLVAALYRFFDHRHIEPRFSGADGMTRRRAVGPYLTLLHSYGRSVATPARIDLRILGFKCVPSNGSIRTNSTSVRAARLVDQVDIVVVDLTRDLTIELYPEGPERPLRSPKGIFSISLNNVAGLRQIPGVGNAIRLLDRPRPSYIPLQTIGLNGRRENHYG